MSKITRTINFPEGLASKILWSPNVDEDSGRSSRSSYVLVAPNSHSHMTSPSVEDLAPENKGESITETKVFDVSDEPVPPIADVSSVVLDGATEPTIDVVSANDSSSNEKEAPSQHQHIIPKLPDSIQEEMKTLISYKFSVDIQIDMVKAHKDFHTEKKQIVEPVVHFYCPHSGCNEVIDEAVRDIAKHEGAEILTLDALELSSAETGILGDRTLLLAVDCAICI
ncbi:hypothetical protein BDQ17DRAFT_202992 [Cyathus striatus]|nr:hypothetical protein BDQ17DRAFT_202992 [Cyathus striatus]